MSFLSAEQPPESFNEEQKEWLARFMRNLDIELNKTAILQRRTDMADKPVIGKAYYFDNAPATVPAITGEGYWGYTSAGWVSLG